MFGRPWLTSSPMSGYLSRADGSAGAVLQDGTIVVRNPGAMDGGTAFRPVKAYQYFLEVW